MVEQNAEIVFRGRRYNVERFDAPARDGQARPHEVVRHPGAAVVLPVLDAERYVFIRNRRPAVNETLLELPAGTLDPNEEPLECATRELTEETGYTAERIEPLTSFFSTPGICDEEMFAFVAFDLIAGHQSLDDGEDIQVEILTRDAALAAARTGRIRDAKSLLTLLFYESFIRER